MSRIVNVNQLSIDTQYWYISVEGCCHFDQIKVVSPEKFIYKGSPDDVKGLIIFDNQKDAEVFRDNFQNQIAPYVIK